jgi:hypothetical protein
VVSEHAAGRLDERNILEWQVVDRVSDGALIADR